MSPGNGAGREGFPRGAVMGIAFSPKLLLLEQPFAGWRSSIPSGCLSARHYIRGCTAMDGLTGTAGTRFPPQQVSTEVWMSSLFRGRPGREKPRV